MLQSKYLSNIYWANAVRITIYIFNRISTSILDDITPYEAWYAKKPNIKHFRVLGYLSYAHIPNESRRKLDPKSQACIFHSYYEQIKVYILYNPKTYKVVVSKDVIFDKGGE